MSAPCFIQRFVQVLFAPPRPVFVIAQVILGGVSHLQSIFTFASFSPLPLVSLSTIATTPPFASRSPNLFIFEFRILSIPELFVLLL